MIIEIFDVEHGQCALIRSRISPGIAMVDCGHNATTGWRPSAHMQYQLRRRDLEALLLTNADQDHFSDLADVAANLEIRTLFRNPTLEPEHLRRLKLENGPLTDDAQAYLDLALRFTARVVTPFHQAMGGIACRTYHNSYDEFQDTNNLSLAVFLEWNGFRVLFPGDLEPEGWQALLRRQEFRNDLAGTTVMLASHHGRSTGLCEEVFGHASPMAIIISDKDPVHDTQDTFGDYCRLVPIGVNVHGKPQRQKVLTTARHGWVQIIADDATHFDVRTQR